jgi:hypothetical protein
MPSTSGMPQSPPAPMPWWLQLLIGVIDTLFPEFAWLDTVLALVYEIWLLIPLFHRAAALMELRKAVQAAKFAKSPAPLEQWMVRWKSICAGGPCSPEVRP